MTDPESNGWNRIAMTVAWVMVLLLLAEASCNTREKLKKVEQDQKFMEERLSDLAARVYFPLFDAHAKNCPVCSKNPGESGKVICDEGLELFKKDAEKLK